MKHILLLFSAMIVIVPPFLGTHGVAMLTLLSVIVRSHVACRSQGG